MRLSPVPIMYWDDVVQAQAVAEKQSRGTHPGQDAAKACAFMAFFIATAIKVSVRLSRKLVCLGEESRCK